MAKSGSFYKTFSTGYRLLLEWSESNVDIANNQSDITVTAKLVSISSSYNINSTASKNISLTINGTKYSSTCTVGLSGGSTKTLMTKTVSNINHSSDGSKSISISCTLGIAVTLSGKYVSSVSTSGTATLTKIARASSLSASNGTLGTEQTLSVTRQSSSFTHTITYTCGSASGTIVSKSSSTSIAWTPPLSLAQQNKTGTSVTVKLTITTYNGDSKVGSSATKTITCSIPSSVKPTVSISVSDPNGYASTYGGYVKGKSKIKVAITASGSQGSTIKSYSTSANGSTYTGSTVTTDVVKSTGTLTIKTTVTDSRGRTASATKAITALAYSDPKISAMTVYRSDSSGNSNKSGAYLTVKFTAAVTSLSSKNTAKYVVKYKKVSDSSYTSATLSSYANNYSPSDAKYTFAADTDSSYNVVLTVTDAFKSTSKTVTGKTTSMLWSILQKGKGIALGKTAEFTDIFEVDFQSRFRKDAYVGATNAWQDGGSGVRISANGGIQIQRGDTTTNPYVHFFLGGSDSPDASIALLASTKEFAFKYALRYLFDSSIYVANNIMMGSDGYDSSASSVLQTYWADNNPHNIVERSTDGLSAKLGWSGSSTYKTVTLMRGQTCQYINSSGTSTLSDERLKKDFQSLEQWESFYNDLEPCAFKMKNGSSGRYHIGFKAQQIKTALEENGLTTADFAGFVNTKYEADEDAPDMNKVFEEAGIKSGDDISCLIYTEFVALNTYHIKKLQKENDELKNKIQYLEKKIEALEKAVTGA